jgi:L-alanine-DL-glutamate epimerase-like enolase superfamily enzyme
VTAARSTKTIPSGKLPRLHLAASIANRVLPAPPVRHERSALDRAANRSLADAQCRRRLARGHLRPTIGSGERRRRFVWRIVAHAIAHHTARMTPRRTGCNNLPRWIVTDRVLGSGIDSFRGRGTLPPYRSLDATNQEPLPVKITNVEVIPLRMPPAEPRPWWVTTPFSHFTTAQNLRAATPSPRPDVANALVVRIETDAGLTGLGNVGVGAPAVQPIVEHHLAPIVFGADPFAVELLWETMFRATLNFGRKGAAVEAISGVDIALWDLMGQATNQPVYNLLGGKTRDTIRCYASQLYATTDLDALAQEAAAYAAQGFTAMKQRIGYGPADGPAGMRKNLELIKTVRDTIGPDVDLAADAYMGWTVPYAVRMIRQIEDAGLNLAWLEEPVLPDQIDGYAEIAAAVDTPISGGEHEFTRYGFHELIDRGAVDVVQLDVNRVGGISEARKIWAMAAGANLPVLPHAGQLHNYHLIMAHLNSPIAEFFPLLDPPDGNTLFWHVFAGEPTPENGYLTLDRRPGLGLSLNEEFVARYRM